MAAAREPIRFGYELAGAAGTGSVSAGGAGGTGSTGVSASPLDGLLPGGASQGSPAPVQVPGQGGGFGGRGGGFGGTNASSFVTTECKEVPQAEWLRGGASTGDTSFPGGPTSSSFTLYDCGSLVSSK